jgi:hypothetical protein
VSPPRRRPPPPEFFVDRSLGRYAVPEAVRALGYAVHTLASVYGEQQGQTVEDVTWLREAGRHDWVVLLKDDRVRRRPAERDALVEARLRVFCLTNAGLRAEEQALRFTTNINRIVQRAAKPGPFVYGVYEDGLRRLWPPA